MSSVPHLEIVTDALEQTIGRDTGSAYIYYVLIRQRWRKILPRSKHPKIASPEAVEASKELNDKIWELWKVKIYNEKQ